jgi:hypothetical protein
MLRTVVITAKIRRDVFNRIKNGEKKFELRDESFEDGDVIKYVAADTGIVLGEYWLGNRGTFQLSGDDADYQALAVIGGVDEDTVRELFPEPTLVFFVRIGDHV